MADVMLGRLARFLRFSGYDVEYDPHAADELLLKRSRFRILLTKDRELFARCKPGRAYFVQSIGAENQLAEIKKQFTRAVGPTRCILCNKVIRKVSKKSIRHLVPPFVFSHHEEFYRCPGCHRIYWPGTHFQRLTLLSNEVTKHTK